MTGCDGCEISSPPTRGGGSAVTGDRKARLVGPRWSMVRERERELERERDGGKRRRWRIEAARIGVDEGGERRIRFRTGGGVRDPLLPFLHHCFPPLQRSYIETWIQPDSGEEAWGPWFLAFLKLVNNVTPGMFWRRGGSCVYLYACMIDFVPFSFFWPIIRHYVFFRMVLFWFMAQVLHFDYWYLELRWWMCLKCDHSDYWVERLISLSLLRGGHGVYIRWWTPFHSCEICLFDQTAVSCTVEEFLLLYDSFSICSSLMNWIV